MCKKRTYYKYTIAKKNKAVNNRDIENGFCCVQNAKIKELMYFHRHFRVLFLLFFAFGIWILSRNPSKQHKFWFYRITSDFVCNFYFVENFANLMLTRREWVKWSNTIAAYFISFHYLHCKQKKKFIRCLYLLIFLFCVFLTLCQFNIFDLGG